MSLAAIILIALISQISSQPIYREPSTPVQIYNRFETPTEILEPVIFLQNRHQSYDNLYPPNLVTLFSDDLKYQPKAPLSLFPNLKPATSEELADFRGPPDEDQDVQDAAIKLNYNKLFKIGDASRREPLKILSSDDTPPEVENLSVEKSELTEETRYLEEVEFGEDTLNDPSTQVEEVYIENITVRPEIPVTDSPGMAVFKKLDIAKMEEDADEGSSTVKVEENESTTTGRMPSSSTTIGAPVKEALVQRAAKDSVLAAVMKAM